MTTNRDDLILELLLHIAEELGEIRRRVASPTDLDQCHHLDAERARLASIAMRLVGRGEAS